MGAHRGKQTAGDVIDGAEDHHGYDGEDHEGQVKAVDPDVQRGEKEPRYEGCRRPWKEGAEPAEDEIHQEDRFDYGHVRVEEFVRQCDCRSRRDDVDRCDEAEGCYGRPDHRHEPVVDAKGPDVRDGDHEYGEGEACHEHGLDCKGELRINGLREYQE